MITLRRSEERGHADHGWLDTYHTFSFAEYHDPRQMGFRSLRVINEDRVEAAMGFGTHPHSDMEIITLVLDGELRHQDSMGNGEVIHAGEVQVMTAGTGITHSEFNSSQSAPVHLMQIWIKPERRGLTPAYGQRKFDLKPEQGLVLYASHDARDGSLPIHQDADLYGAKIEPGQVQKHELKAGRHAWIQVLSGAVEVNGAKLNAGDGAAISEEARLELRGATSAEVLLFDLA